MTLPKTVHVNSAFFEAFAQDPDDLHRWHHFLDRTTGYVLAVAPDDDEAESLMGTGVDNRQKRLRVEGDPDRYLEIPASGGHLMGHEALLAFLDSPWTDDVQRREEVRNAYDGSLRHWRERLGEVYWLFEEFEQQYLRERARMFLIENGIHDTGAALAD